MKKRVAVTGLGVVSCFGSDLKEYYNALLRGESGVKPITSFDTEQFGTKFAATIDSVDTEGYLNKKQTRRIDKFIAYSVVAGKKALENAMVPLDTVDMDRMGIIIGSGMGGLDTFSQAGTTLNEKGPKRMSPFFVPFVITNMASAFLAMELGCMGPNYSVSTACATSNNAIINAAGHIRNGEADIMICGGSEASISEIGLGGFGACRALSKRNNSPKQASRPFDKGRDGFVMGEGAGVLVLEEWEHAKKRGATIYAEYLGGGLSCDAHHITEPRSDGKGVALCIERALKDAGVDVARVNMINAHATSTPAGDHAEIEALSKVFPDPSKIYMNATKSMIGHALGGAGGLEAVALIMGMKEGRHHPTINLDDPEDSLKFVTSSTAKEWKTDVAISNSFGFGGHNATVVFG